VSAQNFLFKDDEFDEILDDSGVETPYPLRLKQEEEIPEMLILSDKKAHEWMCDEMMGSDDDMDQMDIDRSNRNKNEMKIHERSSNGLIYSLQLAKKKS